MSAGSAEGGATEAETKGGDAERDRLKPLPEGLAKEAKAELGEDPETREAFLKEMREKLRGDSKRCAELEVQDSMPWLLRFARAKRFDLERSVNAVWMYYELRRKLGMNAKRSLKLERMLREPTPMSLLPTKDKLGRRIVYLAASRFDLERRTLVEYGQVMLEAVEAFLMRDEETSIRGIVVVEDGEEQSNALLSRVNVSDFPEGGKFVAQVLLRALPVRLRVAFVVNAPWWERWAYDFVGPFLSSKVADRLHVLEGTDDLWNSFDRAAIPTELGGFFQLAETDFLIDSASRTEVSFPGFSYLTFPMDSSVVPSVWGMDVDVRRRGYVRVALVNPGSFAKKMGIEVDMVLESVDGDRIRTIPDLQATVKRVSQCSLRKNPLIVVVSRSRNANSQ